MTGVIEEKKKKKKGRRREGEKVYIPLRPVDGP